jgi:serine protease AprX
VKYLFLLALTVAVGTAGVIDPILQDQMDYAANGELIPVFINITGEVDQEYIDLATAGMSWDQRRAFVVDALKAKAEETQQSILEELKGFNADQVELENTFWLTNAVHCSITPLIIREMASRDDVYHISFAGALEPGKCLIEPIDVHPATPEELGRANAWGVDQVNAPAVWGMGYEGNGIIVAVTDTGVNYFHVDLQNNMWHDTPGGFHYGWDFYDNDPDPMDSHGHGTHCAGSVAGYGTAGTQTGVAPSATIMALRLNYFSGGEATWIQCYEFAVDHGAHVITTSLGIFSASNHVSMRQAEEAVLTAGLLHSIAAGNDGPGAQTILGPGYCPPPWIHPDQPGSGGLTATVTVGATDNSDNIASFSSRGPTDLWGTVAPWNDWADTEALIDPDICAPGVNIVSCSWPSTTGYTTMSGTSMATPHLAGVTALLWDVNPPAKSMTVATVDSIMEVTAVELGTAGKDNTYGSGRVDAYQAALAAISVGIGDTAAPVVPSGVLLSSISPNPVYSTVLFDVYVLNAGQVEISVFDIYGRKTAVIDSGSLPQGSNSFAWEVPDSMSNGIYFVTVSSGSGSAVARMIILR